MAIHYAHLVMLAERGIVSRARRAQRFATGSKSISLRRRRVRTYDGTCEDLFFYIERLIVAGVRRGSGRPPAHRALRNDIDMTMYRMQQREMILGVLEGVAASCAGARSTSPTGIARRSSPRTRTRSPRSRRRSRTTCWPSSNNCERDTVRLRPPSRPPIGIRSEPARSPEPGFRSIASARRELLGFDAPTGNTYGSIATVDYLLESASAGRGAR